MTDLARFADAEYDHVPLGPHHERDRLGEALVHPCGQVLEGPSLVLQHAARFLDGCAVRIGGSPSKRNHVARVISRHFF